jgi:hypothetical protein
VRVGELGVEPREALVERPGSQVPRRDAEELVVVAPLLAGVVDGDRSRAGVRNGHGRDAPHQVVELVLDVTDRRVGVGPLLVGPGRARRRHVGAQQVGEADDAATQEVQHAGLQPLPPEVLEIRLHRGHVRLGVVDVDVAGGGRGPFGRRVRVVFVHLWTSGLDTDPTGPRRYSNRLRRHSDRGGEPR